MEQYIQVICTTFNKYNIIKFKHTVADQQQTYRSFIQHI